MAGKSRMPQDVLRWIITDGFKRYTVKELTDVTGNIIKPSAMSLLLKLYNVKAITMQDRAESAILELHRSEGLISIMETVRRTGYCHHLVRKIIHKHRLPVKSALSKKVSKNRWGKKAYRAKRKAYKKRNGKQAAFDWKKEQVKLMLSQNRPSW